MEALVRGVVLFAPTTSAELLARLEGLESTIIELNVKLVIIDSIAALARAEYGGSGRTAERQELLGEQASRLKALAEAFRIPVIVTNQVTTARGDAAGFAEARSGPLGAGAEAQLVASLGTKWAHDVNLRLALETSEFTGSRCEQRRCSWTAGSRFRRPSQVHNHHQERSGAQPLLAVRGHCWWLVPHRCGALNAALEL